MSFVENVGVKVNDYFSRLEVDDEDGNEFTDRWNTGELLCLASAVQRSGDKNWVSVTRAIKPFGDPKRPFDWYTPKNCALQYSKLLKGVEDFKKKSLPRTERETSEELLIKNLTDKRLTELNWLNHQSKALANSLKLHMELLECGEYDEHLDDLYKQIEEQEKREEEDFKEWIIRRETVNAAKKLNKCRITLSKGKAPSRVLDSKRKNSQSLDLEDNSVHSTVLDIIKQEIDADHEFSPSSKPIHIKTESDAPSSIAALLEGCKSTPIISSTLSAAPTSPLLTSLLRSIPSSNSGAQVVSYVNSPLKEADSPVTLDIKTELDLSALLGKSQETSPRSSLPQSPRPTPASSPLLNSLLKNSPSAASPLTSIQLSQGKENSTSKAVSSPQSFFNPTSALATAAAQQLAVATSSLPQSHMYFSSQDSEIRKLPLPSSPATSACLSAPTLSKLLEMPPSTPGRLPPLPVVDPVTNTVTTPPATTPDPVLMPSPKKPPTATMLLNDLELHISASSPTRKSTEVISTTHLSPVCIQSSPKKVLTPVSSGEKLIVVTSAENVETVTVDPKVSFKHPSDDVTSQENIDILEAVCESINQAFEKKEIKQEVVDPEMNQYTQGNPSNKNPVCADITSSVLTMTENSLPDDLLNSINIEKLVSSDIVLDKVFSSEDISDTSDLNIFEDDKQKSSDMEVENPPDIPTFEAGSEGDDEDKANGRKFYKSRTTKRKLSDDDSENPAESQDTPKKPSKSDVLPQISVNEHSLAAKEAEETTMHKTPEKSPSKLSETKSPVAKKPRLFEKIATKEKKELSEDETPVAKRPGRKAKKGRRMTKSTPVKQDEPKDQYEFSESTEENSVGYQATNTLCYMPRSKDDIRFDEAKIKQGSEDINPPSSINLNVEKKPGIPVKSKLGRPPSQLSARKALFTSDEERMSDSMTSDDASSSHFGEANLKWKEFTEKKEETTKDVEEGSKTSQKPAKMTESPKKKLQQIKRNLFAAKSETPKKEKKIVGSDIEESSACSRDSEDAASATAWPREETEGNEEKDNSPNVAEDVEAEANNDSHMSSSIAAESDKQMDEVEGCESLQGSVTTDFSPLPQSEVKEEKDLTQYGKQDWFHGASPKSSEPVSQSSEESDYESDNWDNQSVSTNKSATHSAGPSSKTKRKDRESPQYKAWKKAIGIVLREASCHKYANVFLQKVTNDVAPGYLNIVYRPMDLSLIKKNVDNGVVKTTAEVHRDLLLMFQNAVMYNSSDHDVHHWAVEMQRDVIQQMQAFLTTQYNDQDEVSEPTSSLRGARSTKSQKMYASSSKSKEETHEKE